MKDSGSRQAKIPASVWALGFVSLFTDIGSEMVHSLLPVLLAGTLGASALTIGLIEGAAESLVLATKVFSGYLSDAFGKRKPLVLLGYGLAALVMPMFPMASSIGTVVTARLLDRFGKGMRGATFRQRVSPKTQRMSLISRERVHDMREMRQGL